MNNDMARKFIRKLNSNLCIRFSSSNNILQGKKQDSLGFIHRDKGNTFTKGDN